VRRASCACERTECQRNFSLRIYFVRMPPPQSILASRWPLFVYIGTSRSIAAFAVFVLIACFSLSAAAQAVPALRVASELSSFALYTRHNIRGHFAASNSSSSLRYAKIHRFHSRQFSETAAAEHDRVHGTWSTSQMSEARYGLAATSLPSQGLALFAGGWDKGVLPLSGWVRTQSTIGWKSKFILSADQFSQIQNMKFIIGREYRTLWTSSTERRGRGRLRG
jgi:hypothetical protein